MENNLVELKYDKVNEYFEKFKKKYTNDYEENKVRIVAPNLSLNEAKRIFGGANMRLTKNGK